MPLDYSKIKPFVYVIVCSDLEPRQIVVQACHAALEAGIHLPQCKDFPSGLIMLQVKDEKALLAAHEHLRECSVEDQLFWEGPMQRYTALATKAIPSEHRHLLRQFKLLRMPGTTWWDDIKRYGLKFKKKLIFEYE